MQIDEIKKLATEHEDLAEFVAVGKREHAQLQILEIGSTYKAVMDQPTIKNLWPLIEGLINDRMYEIKQALES